MNFISERKAQFKQRQEQVLERKTISTLNKLDVATKERQALQIKSDLENQLRKEKQQIHELRTEKVRNTFNNIKGLTQKVQQHQAKVRKKNKSLVLQNSGGVFTSEYRGPFSK
jgi:GTPase involved in cell partitioning and DNA repair